MPLVGCGESNGGGGSGGSAGTGGTGGSGGADTTEVSLIVTGWNPEQGATVPLEGVEICRTGTTTCVMTDAAGRATTEVPVGQEISATFEKEGYASYLLPGVFSEDPDVFSFGMATEDRIDEQHQLVMSPYPMEGTGDLAIILDPAFAGATFDLGDAAGKVFYHDEQGNWDADLTATLSWGWGGFTEVSPGEVQVEFGGTAEGCVPTIAIGWPGDVENSVRVPIQVGYVSEISVACDAP
jgi:hypothetical protein